MNGNGVKNMIAIHVNIHPFQSICFTDLNITFLIHDFEHVQMDRLVSSFLGLLKESSIELDEGYDTIVAPKSEFLFPGGFG